MRKLLAFLLLLTACSSPSPKVSYFRGVAMTIPYTILIGEPITSKERKTLSDCIHKTFQEVHETFNTFNARSELSRLNRSPAKIPIELSSSLSMLLHQAWALHLLTEGRFDPVAGARLRHKHADEGNFSELSLQESILIKERPHLEIDLGGIAKGYAVDLLAARLHDEGITHLFVDWGGEIVAHGQHPDARPWRVALSHQSGITIELEGALATSGTEFQSWRDGNQRFSHFINPKTHLALEIDAKTPRAVTVKAPTCTEADAIATALMLFPTKKAAAAWMSSLQKERPELIAWIS